MSKWVILDADLAECQVCDQKSGAVYFSGRTVWIECTHCHFKGLSFSVSPELLIPGMMPGNGMRLFQEATEAEAKARTAWNQRTVEKGHTQ